MSELKTILQRFPVRKTAAQKDAFRTWLTDTLRAQGYTPRVEEHGRAKRKAVVVGNPDKAAVLLVACEGTPARRLLPDARTPGNPLLAGLMLFGKALLLLIPALAVYLLVYWLSGSARMGLWALVATYAGLVLLLKYGPANPHNANQSSGIAALLALLASLAPEERSLISAVFLEDTEVGGPGCRAWCKGHLQAQYTTLTVWVDAVGRGEQLVCTSSRLAQKCTGYRSLERAITEEGGICRSSIGSALRYDRPVFKCASVLQACAKKPLIGWYTGKIGTVRDTECDPEAIHRTAAALHTFLTRLAGTDSGENS